jgi:hypothetical protein
MKCEKFLAVVNELAREHQRAARHSSTAAVLLMEANDGNRDRALSHTAECQSCAARWEAERSLSVGLHQLAEEMKSLAAPSQLEASVLAAFRERASVIPTVRPFPLQRRPARYWIAAIAAALLIVFAIFVVRGRVFPRAAPELVNGGVPKITPPHNLQAIVPEKSSPALKQNDAPTPVHAPRRSPRSSLALNRPSAAGRIKGTNLSANAGAVASNLKNNGENNEGNKEVATGFFPIGYGTSPNLQDGGQLLRVELPRSAVARFGLPVNIDRGSERVKADVLVGADGLAQAIRFVH